MSDSDSGLLGGDTDKSSSTPAADITDTFNLFKCYLDSSLNSFKKELLDSQEDNSPAGWATVHQYEHNDIASDSDDDKKLPVIGNISRLMTRKCYEIIESRFAWDSLIRFDSSHEFLQELSFWSKNLDMYNCRFMKDYSKSIAILCTDASSVAAGAVCQLSGTHKYFHSNFSEVESAQSSTWRELKAIQLALFSYKENLSGKSVKILTDSKNCVSIVQSGSTKNDLHVIALSIFHLCLQRKISLDIAWIPREMNETADYLSKLVDYDDWSVSDEFFEFMNNMWGPYTVDRFANYLNKKLPRFNSLFWNPGTDAVDCFSQDWSSDNNWLVPPIHLVMRSLRHLMYCRSRGTLIVPYWPSAPFWSMIFGPDMTYRSYVTDVIQFNDV
ncbi:uncharacterized protein LOC128188443 isoform X2 [Crassostrea angulata]|uniref:uncharacterized protein LOC128188443 isoform X2 n=1 Tax=Magallana angulata TaxID=2784310 RepID=UPI0022B1E5BF|nr:uncharacterized protein LOC128188443 isoform X2 [Crassostrea angulata]